MAGIMLFPKILARSILSSARLSRISRFSAKRWNHKRRCIATICTRRAIQWRLQAPKRKRMLAACAPQSYNMTICRRGKWPTQCAWRFPRESSRSTWRASSNACRRIFARPQLARLTKGIERCAAQSFTICRNSASQATAMAWPMKSRKRRAAKRSFSKAATRRNFATNSTA